MSEVIRTERLVMRRAAREDVAPLHRLMSHPEAMRYWSTPAHETLERTEAWLASMMDAPADAADDFIVTLDGALIGKLGCWRLPEVGFLFDPVTWGHGYAAEAMLAFIDRRRSLGSTQLTADVDPRNQSSIRLLERVGFRESGRAARTWNVGGVWCDSIYYRLALEGAP
jgi:RimJ/RimL family protein N-acetyltransferase